MALSKLQFTKDWTDPSDFPTYELEEAKVRADLQYLHDETKDFINDMIDELSAAQIPFSPTAAIQESSVQDAIENVQQQITGAIADGAVTESKLADGAVTSGKIASGAVTADKIAAGTLSGKADLNESGKVTAEQVSRDIISVTAGKTFSLSDAGTFQYVTASSDVTITIPDDASVAFPVDTEIEIFRYGEGKVTVAPADGVSTSSSVGYTIGERYGFVKLKKTAQNTWMFIPGGGGNAVAPASCANMLHNWDFRTPVNQRGKTSYTGAGYTIDRWRAAESGVTVSVQSGYITLSASSAGDTYFRQYLESSLESGTYTFSALLRGTGSGAVGFGCKTVSAISEITSTSFSSVGSSFQLVSCTLTVTDEDVNTVLIKINAGTSFDILAVKLEKNALSTLQNDAPADPALELLKCQRFYLPLEQGGVAAYGVFSSSESIAVVIPTPVKLRDNAEIVLTNTGSVYSATGYSVPYFSSILGVSSAGVSVELTLFDGTEALPGIWIDFAGSISADL